MQIVATGRAVNPVESASALIAAPTLDVLHCKHLTLICVE